MRRASFDDMDCSVARTLDVVGERWTLLVIRDAFFGLRRFEDFQAHLGIARNVLAARLKKLVGDGVLERRRYEKHPPRYEYRLTGKGLELFPVLLTLMQWGDRWTAGKKGPPLELTVRKTGERLEPVLVDRRTGRPIEARETAVKAGPGARRETRRALEGLALPEAGRA